MTHVLDTSAYLDMVCQLLREGQTAVPVPVKGVSMRPFLRDGDMVYLDPITAPVKPGDIVLFQRPGGQYVLHRVYRRLSGGWVLMLGDSERMPERVADSQMRAVAVSASCGGQRVSAPRWWFYRQPWRRLAPMRKQIGWVWGKLKR